MHASKIKRVPDRGNVRTMRLVHILFRKLLTYLQIAELSDKIEDMAKIFPSIASF